MLLMESQLLISAMYFAKVMQSREAAQFSFDDISNFHNVITNAVCKTLIFFFFFFTGNVYGICIIDIQATRLSLL